MGNDSVVVPFYLFVFFPESRRGDGRQSVASSETTGGVASKNAGHFGGTNNADPLFFPGQTSVIAVTTGCALDDFACTQM